MEILGEIQSSEGREEELQAVLQSEDMSSVPPSGPSENATSALDEPVVVFKPKKPVFRVLSNSQRTWRIWII